MKKLVLGLAALPFLAGIAWAGQQSSLTDAQMDKVTAGLSIDIALIDLPPNAQVPTLPVFGVEHVPGVCAITGCLTLDFPSADGAPNNILSFPVIFFGPLH